MAADESNDEKIGEREKKMKKKANLILKQSMESCANRISFLSLSLFFLMYLLEKMIRYAALAHDKKAYAGGGGKERERERHNERRREDDKHIDDWNFLKNRFYFSFHCLSDIFIPRWEIVEMERNRAHDAGGHVVHLSILLIVFILKWNTWMRE